jgi:hypothetical protein
MCSSVVWRVLSKPISTIPTVSPTKITGTPAGSSDWAIGEVYAVNIGICSIPFIFLSD